jgi:hypothetical protein
MFEGFSSYLTVNTPRIYYKNQPFDTRFTDCAANIEAPPTHTVTSLVNRTQLEARPTRQSYGNQWLQRHLEGAPDDGRNSARNMLSGVYAIKQ